MHEEPAMLAHHCRAYPHACTPTFVETRIWYYKHICVLCWVVGGVWIWFLLGSFNVLLKSYFAVLRSEPIIQFKSVKIVKRHTHLMVMQICFESDSVCSDSIGDWMHLAYSSKLNVSHIIIANAERACCHGSQNMRSIPKRCHALQA